ncbi:MAG: hypothetical protein FWE84_06290, partial [Firmicutes bacterium]|nr:hypothetical protein [Bacillota bacterium]
MDFAESYKKYRELFERYLDKQLAVMRGNSPSAALFSAVEYALKNGGKRLRPVLYLAVYDFLTGGKLLRDGENEEASCGGV